MHAAPSGPVQAIDRCGKGCGDTCLNISAGKIHPAGSMIQIPPGVAHKFRNVGPAQARHLALVTPGMAGLRAMEAAAQADFSDPQALADELRRHNTELLADPSRG